MECGDANRKYFQAFGRGRKQQNIISELKNENNQTVNTFEYLADIGKKYFEKIFKEGQQTTISEVV